MTTARIPAKNEREGVPLRFFLGAEPAYVTGRPITITFTLENVTNEDLYVLNWYTPLEGLAGKIFDVMCDGKTIRYEGIMVKRGNPRPEDYTYIAPHSTVKVVSDISEVYHIPPCRECRVTFRGRVHDIVREKNLLPRKSGEHLGLDIPGNTVSFRVTG